MRNGCAKIDQKLNSCDPHRSTVVTPNDQRFKAGVSQLMHRAD